MKLAEALILRSDLQNRLELLRERLRANALVQEGEKPAEDPAALLEELSSGTAQLEELIARINLSNAVIRKDGKTLTELLAHREALTLRISIARSLLETASRPIMRGSRMEVKIFSTVDVAAIRQETDGLSQELRLLDTAIQSTNWTEELR